MTTPSDFWAEEERASAALSRRVRDFDDDAADAPPAVPLLGARSAADEHTGRVLADRLGPFNRKRVDTLLRFERAGGLSDFGILMAPLCVTLESELVRVLGDPARGVRMELAQMFDAAGRPDRGKLLRQWTPDRFATLGTVGLVAAGMMGALAATTITPAVTAIRQFVDTLPPGYAAAVREQDYCDALEQLRQVRNRVAHRDDPFGRREYEGLVQLAVCHDRVNDWYATGPALRPVPWQLGTLQHHLLAMPPGAPLVPLPLARLFEVGPNGGVRLTVRPVASGSRARVVGRPTAPDSFALGSRVVYEVASEGGVAGRLLLLNRDVFGVTRLLAWGELGESGRFTFPDGEFDVRLTDGPGEEVVKAIVTRHPLPLSPAPGDPSREVSDAEAERLTAALDALPAGEWWQASVRMDVVS